MTAQQITQWLSFAIRLFIRVVGLIHQHCPRLVRDHAVHQRNVGIRRIALAVFQLHVLNSFRGIIGGENINVFSDGFAVRSDIMLEKCVPFTRFCIPGFIIFSDDVSTAVRYFAIHKRDCRVAAIGQFHPSVVGEDRAVQGIVNFDPLGNRSILFLNPMQKNFSIIWITYLSVIVCVNHFVSINLQSQF